MKIPKKIYIHPDIGGREFLRPWLHRPANNDSIEYTITDAFIEKAEEFIYSALNDGIMGTCNIEDFMRLFKKYMKGE